MAIDGGSVVYKTSLDSAGLQQGLQGAAKQFGGLGDAAGVLLGHINLVELSVAGIATAAMAAAAAVDGALMQMAFNTGKAGEELAAMNQMVLDIGKNEDETFAQVAQAVGVVTQRLHLSGEAARVAAEKYLTVGHAFKIENTDEFVKLMTSTQNAWGVGTELLDKFVVASQETGVSIMGLASEMQAFGATFRNMGYGVDEATATLANFEAKGVPASRVIMAFRMALMGLGGDEEALGAAIRRIKELTDAGDKAGAVDLAGKLFKARGASEMIDAIKRGALSANELTEKIKNADGAVGKLEDSTLKAQLEKSWNAVQVALLPIGKQLEDMVKAITPVAVGFAQIAAAIVGNPVVFHFLAWSAALKLVTMAIGPVIGGIGLLKTALLTLKVEWLALQGAGAANYFGAMGQAAMAAIPGVAGLGVASAGATPEVTALAVATNAAIWPITLIVVALAAVAAGVMAWNDANEYAASRGIRDATGAIDKQQLAMVDLKKKQSDQIVEAGKNLAIYEKLKSSQDGGGNSAGKLKTVTDALTSSFAEMASQAGQSGTVWDGTSEKMRSVINDFKNGSKAVQDMTLDIANLELKLAAAKLNKVVGDTFTSDRSGAAYNALTAPGATPVSPNAYSGVKHFGDFDEAKLTQEQADKINEAQLAYKKAEANISSLNEQQVTGFSGGFAGLFMTPAMKKAAADTGKAMAEAVADGIRSGADAVHAAQLSIAAIDAQEAADAANTARTQEPAAKADFDARQAIRNADKAFATENSRAEQDANNNLAALKAANIAKLAAITDEAEQVKAAQAAGFAEKQMEQQNKFASDDRKNVYDIQKIKLQAAADEAKYLLELAQKRRDMERTLQNTSHEGAQKVAALEIQHNSLIRQRKQLHDEAAQAENEGKLRAIDLDEQQAQREADMRAKAISALGLEYTSEEKSASDQRLQYALDATTLDFENRKSMLADQTALEVEAIRQTEKERATLMAISLDNLKAAYANMESSLGASLNLEAFALKASAVRTGDSAPFAMTPAELSARIGSITNSGTQSSALAIIKVIDDKFLQPFVDRMDKVTQPTDSYYKTPHGAYMELAGQSHNSVNAKTNNDEVNAIIYGQMKALVGLAKTADERGVLADALKLKKEAETENFLKGIYESKLYIEGIKQTEQAKINPDTALINSYNIQLEGFSSAIKQAKAMESATNAAIDTWMAQYDKIAQVQLKYATDYLQTRLNLEDMLLQRRSSNEELASSTQIKYAKAAAAAIGGAQGAQIIATADAQAANDEYRHAKEIEDAKLSAQFKTEARKYADEKGLGNMPYADILAKMAGDKNGVLMIENIWAAYDTAVHKLGLTFAAKKIDVELNIAKSNLDEWKRGLKEDFGGLMFDNKMFQAGLAKAAESGKSAAPNGTEAIMKLLTGIQAPAGGFTDDITSKVIRDASTGLVSVAPAPGNYGRATGVGMPNTFGAGTPPSPWSTGAFAAGNLAPFNPGVPNPIAAATRHMDGIPSPLDFAWLQMLAGARNGTAPANQQGRLNEAYPELVINLKLHVEDSGRLTAVIDNQLQGRLNGIRVNINNTGADGASQRYR